MMMPRYNMLVAAALGVLILQAFPPSAQAGTEGHEAMEQKIQLSDVPSAAMKAARGALGAEPNEAYLVTGAGGEKVYELEVDKNGKEVAVHVTSTGKIVQREEGEEHEEHE